MYIGGIPIVSLDKIYLSPDENIWFLDCTRLDGSKKLVSRNNVNRFNIVEEQIRNISLSLLVNGLKEIVLVDDVVFSGSVLRTVIQEFMKNGIKVLGIRSSVSMEASYNSFNKMLPLGIKCGFLLGDKVIDQVCERDFYFGVAQSGISVLGDDGLIYKKPYFMPYGNPVERASIPEMYKQTFSKCCLRRSVSLWTEIERLSNREIYIRDLPEKIIGVDETKEVVKVLKKELKRI